VLYLSNKHDPLKNSSLIDSYSYHKLKHNTALKETIETHKSLIKQSLIVPRPEPKSTPVSYLKMLGSAFARLSRFATKADASISE